MVFLFEEDRQAMYMKRNTQARSRNRCYGQKAISITYSECVFVELGTPASKAHKQYYIFNCGLYGSTIFFPHYLGKGRIFGGGAEGKDYWT